MKKTIIVEIEIPDEGTLYDAEIRDYVVNAIEGYSIETGHLCRQFKYGNYPRVNSIKIKEN